MVLNTLLFMSLRASNSCLPQTKMSPKKPCKLPIGKNVTLLCSGEFSILLFFLKALLKREDTYFCTNVNRLGLENSWETFF
jgi:hypothetical protein